MNGIAKYKLLGLDSNIFIYQFEENPEFIQTTEKVFELLERDKIQAVTSIISIVEALSYPAPIKVLKMIKNSFETMPNLTILDVNSEVGIEAAKIRRKYGFRLPDSIQLATAKLGKAKAFVTNDQRLKAFKALKVILLSEIN